MSANKQPALFQMHFQNMLIQNTDIIQKLKISVSLKINSHNSSIPRVNKMKSLPKAHAN